MQRFLAENGFPPGDIDGTLGGRTRQAIRAYQSSAPCLRPTGYLDRLTLLQIDADDDFVKYGHPAQGAEGFAQERANFDIRPQSCLKEDVGTKTPVSVPGGKIVHTEELRGLLAAARPDRSTALLIDALADGTNARHETAKGAVRLPHAGLAGSFSDANQARLGADLDRLTVGRKNTMLIFFCQGVVCWESYNAVLRTARLGYQNIYWYRGGLAAWREAGLPMEP